MVTSGWSSELLHAGTGNVLNKQSQYDQDMYRPYRCIACFTRSAVPSPPGCNSPWLMSTSSNFICSSESRDPSSVTPSGSVTFTNLRAGSLSSKPRSEMGG